jgi:hypothetical protein
MDAICVPLTPPVPDVDPGSRPTIEMPATRGTIIRPEWSAPTRSCRELSPHCTHWRSQWHTHALHLASATRRAGTMNVNIRYGQMTMALIAQTVIHQLRTRLGEPYRTWDANHLATDLFFALEGDVKVQDNTILVTYYNAPNAAQLRAHYEGLRHKLRQDNINPAIPWLYGFQLDFCFR